MKNYQNICIYIYFDFFLLIRIHIYTHYLFYYTIFSISNLQRIKHEYESNGARFDKKQDLIKNESFLKTQHKIKQRQERRKKNITQTKLLPVTTTKSTTQNGEIANENDIIDNKNFKSKDENDNHRRASNVMHGITSDFRHDTSDYQHEAELIKNKQLEHTKKRLEQRRNSSTIHTTVAIDSV